MYCGKTVRHRAKGTWQAIYEKSIGTKMNDLDFLFGGRFRSCQSFRRIRHWITRSETVRKRGFVDHHKEMAYGKSNDHVINDVTWPRKVKPMSRDPSTLRAQYLENSWRCYLATCNNSAVSLWGSAVGYPSDSLASCVFILSCILLFIQCMVSRSIQASRQQPSDWSVLHVQGCNESWTVCVRHCDENVYHSTDLDGHWCVWRRGVKK